MRGSRQIFFLWDGNTHGGGTEWWVELWSHLQPLPCLHTVAERGKKCTPSIPSHHHTGWQGSWHPAPIPADFPLPGARAHTLIEHVTTICSGTGIWHAVQTISFDEEIFVFLLSSFLIGLLLGRTGRDWKYSPFLISQICKNQSWHLRNRSRTHQDNTTLQDNIFIAFSPHALFSPTKPCSLLP